MLKQGGFLFLVFIIAALINGCPACFRSNDYKRSVLQTGLSFFQECQCTEPGYTIENLKWLDIHDQPIESGPGTSNVVYTEEAQDSIFLYIPSITKSMSGEYKCVTEVEGIRYVQTYAVDAYEPLYFFKTPHDQHLILGNNSTIACEARGESLPRISWQKEIDGENVELPVASKHEITPEGLLIKDVTLEDAGKYKCTALVMSTGEEVDAFIDVDVLTVPVIEEIRGHPDTTVIAGNSLSVECIAEGVPTPQYAWKKIGTENINKTWTQSVNTITFNSIHADDEGLYECYAYNEAGGSKRVVNVEVLVPPRVTHFPNITDVEGTMIQLICNASGKPEPNITISYEGWDIESDWELSEYEVIPNKAFFNLAISHEGVYVCNATNEVGYGMAPMYLTVLHKPYFKGQRNDLVVWGYEGKTVKLNCAQFSNPPAIIFWRFESNAIPTENVVEINKSLEEIREDYLTVVDTNSTFGLYVCTARNLLGEASKYFTLKEGFRPPAIEAEINITDVTATSVTFKIQGPFTKDAPEILGYTAQYDEELNYDVTDIHLNRTWSIDRPYKIEKLKPNTRYLISFAAVNEVGAGEYGDHLVFTTLEKSAPESPVLEESIQRSSVGTHLLKWKETADNGEPIDHYTLKYCPVYEEMDEQLCVVSQVAPTTELELTDLESNTTYFLELVAHNAEGNSTPANITITIPPLEEELDEEPETTLSGGAIIGIAIIVVLLCLVLLDLLLLAWRRQGIIAACCLNKDKKRKEDTLNSRDKKNLLIVEPVDTRPDNGHREYEYNKNTGIVIGKNSAV